MDDERGAVTAEFAIVLPAVLLVLGLVIGGILLAAHRVVLTSAAADLARLEARGDAELAAARLSELGGGIRADRESIGGLLCVTLGSRPGGGALAVVEITARGCAARSDAGRGEE
ncbi:pilus assembly protein [Leucobacter sp. CSA1]|uniref:Pilus assembly protein n=1 Tax=Leucobacter chromiisoli TaxID=2796471 RepID=A0A934UV57_9MICO|nr:TadE family protein [Leucobacter chromiisoli]MBK0420229.1 pilus assembly protein [Leucobacter chromiisoli]